MRIKFGLLLPVSLAFAAVSPPVAAQTTVERDTYQPLYYIALERLQREVDVIAELQTKLEMETVLERGCATLNETVEHLNRADEILTDIEGYTQKLRMKKERKAGANQQKQVREDIGLKEGDIERMCGSFTTP